MRIPASLTAGDSATWVDYPFTAPDSRSITAATHQLSYSLRGPVGAAGLDLAATAVGTTWTFALTTAQSAALNTGATPAKWYWQAYATKTGERITAGDGVLLVRPNLAGISGATFDGRSQAEQILSTLEAAILARVNGDAVTEYTIGSRSLKKEPLAELLKLRSQYRLIVGRERKAQSIKNGLGNPSSIGVRFGA